MLQVISTRGDSGRNGGRSPSDIDALLSLFSHQQRHPSFQRRWYAMTSEFDSSRLGYLRSSRLHLLSSLDYAVCLVFPCNAKSTVLTTL